MQSSRAAILVREVEEGFLEEAGYAVKMGLPAKRLAAMRFVQILVKVRDVEVSDDR